MGKTEFQVERGAIVGGHRGTVFVHSPICKKDSCSFLCHLAHGMRCDVKETVQFHFLLGSFLWNFQFKILEGGPFTHNTGARFPVPLQGGDRSEGQRILLPFCSTPANEI